MKQKRFSKILVFLCSVVLLMSNINLHAFATETAGTNEVKSEDYKEVLHLDAFTGVSAKTWGSGQTEVLSADGGNLDGVLIDGVYNISRYASVQIGSKDQYRLQLRVNNQNTGMIIGFYIGNEGYQAETFTGVYGGADINVKTGFSYTHVYDDQTADVLIKIQVENTIYKEINLEKIPVDKLPRTIFVNPSTDPSGSVTFMVKKDEPTVLGVRDFTGADEVEYPKGGTTVLKAGGGTLDGVVFDGFLSLARYTNIQIGTTANGSGYRFQLRAHQTTPTLYFHFAGPNGVAWEEHLNYNATTGLKEGAMMRVKVAFTYINKNYTTGKADVKIKLNIGDLVERENTVTGVVMSQLTRSIFVAHTDAAVCMKQVDDTPDVFGVKDLIGQEEATYTGEAIPISFGDATETLDGVVIDGIFNFTKSAMIFMGSNAYPYNRFQMGVNNAYDLIYQFANRAVPTGASRTYDFDASATVQQTIGYRYGDDLRIKVAFSFSNKNYYSGTADVTIKVNIGDLVEEQFTVTGVAMAELPRKLYIQPTDGRVIMKEADDTPTVLSMKDFMGKDEEVYEGANGTYTILEAGTETVDGVVIDGVFNFDKYACIFVGSNAHPYNRFQIGVNNAYDLYYQYCNNGIANVEGASSSYAFDTDAAVQQEIGAKYGEDVHIKIAFTFSNRNYVTGIADVTVKINIGERIEKEFTVPGVTMSHLPRKIYVSPGGAKATIKATTDYRTVEQGFAIDGEGITVDGESTTNTVLETPGDYFVRSTGKDIYAKYVVVYTPGDVRLDGKVGAIDLVGVKKAVQLQEAFTTKAAKKAADADGSGAIDADDCKAVRNILLN